ncbi:uncharacterized protein LOC121997345 [Zingiber officinale]|uniref:uncharacterized protein LOC121997345 n=1 Tax=Zingiber officinale TaxID=94328 RepID=UPI001C4ABD5C|nr:uncharacterized protein LOC121997345 [Zingiber officinale]
MAVRGFRGVRDDLSELGRQFLDIACFLSPLLTPAHHDSPPPSPRPSSSPSPPPSRAEISGGFRSGLSRLSGALRVLADRDRALGDLEVGSSDVGVSEDVLEFVDDLVKCPESWLEFPVPIDGEFDMSHTQREHISTVQHFKPSLQSLRLRLCTTHLSEDSFWKIYFALLHPKLNKHDSELLSTCQIVDSMRIKAKEISNREATQSHVPDSQSSALSATDKSVSIQQEHGDAWQDTTMVKTQSQQSIDRWSEVSGGADGATTFHPDGISFGNKGNALVMEKYMDSLFPKEQGHLPPYLRRKHISTDEENVRYRKGSKLKVSSDEESSDWQAVEDSDFEVLEK